MTAIIITLQVSSESAICTAGRVNRCVPSIPGGDCCFHVINAEHMVSAVVLSVLRRVVQTLREIIFEAPVVTNHPDLSTRCRSASALWLDGTTSICPGRKWQ